MSDEQQQMAAGEGEPLADALARLAGGEPPARLCVNGHPFVSGTTVDNDRPSDLWCDVCGETQPVAGGEPTRPSDDDGAMDMGFLSLPAEVQDGLNAYAAERYAAEKLWRLATDRSRFPDPGFYEQFRVYCEARDAAVRARVVAAVEALHPPQPHFDGHGVHRADRCRRCTFVYPCPTVRAARGATGGGT